MPKIIIYYGDNTLKRTALGDKVSEGRWRFPNPEFAFTRTQLPEWVDDLISIDKKYLIETDSDLLLLRVRRRIAEGTLPSDSVQISYITPEGVAQRIWIESDGTLSNWPEKRGLEHYEEIKAILRATSQVGKVKHPTT